MVGQLSRIAALGSVATALWTHDAHAQFFSTSDAAVVDEQQADVETTAPLATPVDDSTSLGLAFGLAPEWELAVAGDLHTVIEERQPHRVDAPSAGLKRLLRAGSLQEATGPSMAAEIVWTRGQRDALGGALIISHGFGFATAHTNLAIAPDDAGAHASLSALLEGPASWNFRPALEIASLSPTLEATTRVGVIWELDDGLALDAGFGHALRSPSQRELGIGLAWSALD